ncbi:DHS-like NAD/FAD-binding domain-containing protein [Hypoxylon sp. FL1284]|nr:DHS-like NAD/FAD-binding domain-containing protein [Hypoxylon sp. FL1284]
MPRPSIPRIPYTDKLPYPRVFPNSCKTMHGAIPALQEFFKSSHPAVVLSGAGISVASGLKDYRGPEGTYRLNKAFRPIYYGEFIVSHEARKRHWARSFFGWSTVQKAKPNVGHLAVKHLGELGFVQSVITQNVDSLHSEAHPELPTVELHGYLRSCVCLSCNEELSRDTFQSELVRLNPAWGALLESLVASGALNTEDPEEKRAKGVRVNPDGDFDFPDAPYTTFRYPPCPRCLAEPPLMADGSRATVEVDEDGAWKPTSTAGVLKPAVIMFGENIQTSIKIAAEQAIDNAESLLILGTSLATYSAFRLAKRAKNRGIPIAIINLGGVRGEVSFFADMDPSLGGSQGLRANLPIKKLLPTVVEQLRQS